MRPRIREALILPEELGAERYNESLVPLGMTLYLAAGGRMTVGALPSRAVESSSLPNRIDGLGEPNTPWAGGPKVVYARMALSSTMYVFAVRIADADRSI